VTIPSVPRLVTQALLNAQYKADSINLVAEIDGHVSECAVDTHGSWGVCVAFSTTHAPFILQQVCANCDSSQPRHPLVASACGSTCRRAQFTSHWAALHYACRTTPSRDSDMPGSRPGHV